MLFVRLWDLEQSVAVFKGRLWHSLCGTEREQVARYLATLLSVQFRKRLLLDR